MVKAETQRTVGCGETEGTSFELTLAAGKASFLFPPMTLRKTAAGTELCYDLRGLVSLDGLFEKDLPSFRRAIGKLPDAAEKAVADFRARGGVVFTKQWKGLIPGEDVEVLEPASFRQRIIERIEGMRGKYNL